MMLLDVENYDAPGLSHDVENYDAPGPSDDIENCNGPGPSLFTVGVACFTFSEGYRFIRMIS